MIDEGVIFIVISPTISSLLALCLSLRICMFQFDNKPSLKLNLFPSGHTKEE